ncbi:hypothetical protein N2152v2_001987 [Parachlorella kessleri]
MQSLGTVKHLAALPARPSKPATPGRNLLPKPAAPLSRLPWLVPHAASFPPASPSSSTAEAAGTAAFVRPDVPPEEDVKAQGPASRWPRAPSSPWPRQQSAGSSIADKGYDKVIFRSALEQVSYNTNKAMMGSVDEELPKKKGGLFSSLRK